jgi:hypothetical protein
MGSFQTSPKIVHPFTPDFNLKVARAESQRCQGWSL